MNARTLLPAPSLLLSLLLAGSIAGCRSKPPAVPDDAALTSQVTARLAADGSLAGQTIHDRPVVGRLDAAAPLEMVDVFRNSAHVGGVVDDAIRIGARVVWMQLGVIDQHAAARAREAGIAVVMDRSR